MRRIHPDARIEAVERRAVVAGFDGGNITLNAGALLGQVDRGLGLIRGFGECSPIVAILARSTPDRDVGRAANSGLVLGYEDLNDHDELRKTDLRCAGRKTAVPGIR